MSLLFYFLLFGAVVAEVGTFPGWFDSPEFALAVETLGVSHPSGHPAYLLLAKPFTWLPFGSTAFRVALGSGVFLCLALYALAEAIRSIQPASSDSAKERALFPLVASLLLALHPSVALQLRPEVYLLSLSLHLGLLVLSLRTLQRRDERLFLLAGFLLGIAFAAQPLLAALSSASLLIALFVAKGVSVRRVALTSLMFTLGALLVIYLPLRAMTAPLLDWDHPTTFKRFLAAITALDYRTFFHSPASPRAHADTLSGGFVSLFPLPFILLGLAGMFWLFRSGQKRSLLLMGVTLAASLLACVLKDFSLGNPDSHAYASLALSSLFVCAAFGARTLFASRLSSWNASWLLSLFLLGASLLRVLPSGMAAWRSQGAEETEALSLHLDALPPGAQVKVGSDHWVFPLWYRSYVERRRPDVAIVSTAMEHASWYVAQLRRHYGPRGIDPMFLETPATEETKTPFGFLFGPATAPPSLLTSFRETCRIPDQKDPFEIRRSVCSFVPVKTAEEFARGGGLTESILLLEQFEGRPASGVTCKPSGDVLLPFPLWEDPDRFVTCGLNVRAKLQLLYLACGRADLSASATPPPGASSDVNTYLLGAYARWTMGRRDAGERLFSEARHLPPAARQAAERAGILLAQAGTHP